MRPIWYGLISDIGLPKVSRNNWNQTLELGMVAYPVVAQQRDAYTRSFLPSIIQTLEITIEEQGELLGPLLAVQIIPFLGVVNIEPTAVSLAQIVLIGAESEHTKLAASSPQSIATILRCGVQSNNLQGCKLEPLFC